MYLAEFCRCCSSSQAVSRHVLVRLKCALPPSVVSSTLLYSHIHSPVGTIAWWVLVLGFFLGSSRRRALGNRVRFAQSVVGEHSLFFLWSLQVSLPPPPAPQHRVFFFFCPYSRTGWL